MKQLTFVGIMFCAALSATPAVAQTGDTLEARVGKVWLRLGMPELQVKQALLKQYDVRPVTGAAGVLLIYEKGSDIGVGGVNFTNGHLVMVTEDWESTDRSEEAIGVLLFKTLSELTTASVGQWRQAASCSVATSRREFPRGGYLMMAITCERKTVSLILHQVPERKGALTVQLQTGSLDGR